MLKTDARADLRQGNNVKIGLVKDNALKTGKPREGGAQHKKSQSKFLHLTQT